MGIKLAFCACLFCVVWKCNTSQERVAQGVFFEDISQNDQLRKQSKQNSIVISESFHRCSLNQKCEFIINDGNEREVQAAVLPSGTEGLQVWRKVRALQENTPEVYTSCKDAMEKGISVSQVVRLSKDGQTFPVFCDMETDGGGWTVFQRRTNDNLSFEKQWHQYEQGFGDQQNNFWLGLKTIHLLANGNNSTLRVELINLTNDKGYAKYSNFKVGDSTTGYMLNVGKYEGNIGDELACSNNMKFTTSDKDNDIHKFANCANSYKGAWWYGACCNSYLNSIYHNTVNNTAYQMTWYSWNNRTGHIAFSEMKFR